MKIAFLSRHQNTINRGAENFVKELSSSLSKKHQVDILVGENSDSISLVIKGEYNFVIPINGRSQSLKISLARLIGRYKVLISGHSGRGWDDIWNIVIGRPDIFVGLTDEMTKWAKKWAIGTKVIKIPNGIDLNKFTPFGKKIEIDLPKPIVLSVGALVWYKYHDRVIEAFSRFNKGSLLIVGEGPLKEQLIQKGNELLRGRFKITSFKYEDMPQLYRSVDLFTLPSWSREAFGIVYLEALASGLGIVVPDDSSRREIIGDAGLFVDVSDSLKYADAIKQALDLKWSEKARKQAEKFSWEKIASLYEKAMVDMLKK